VLPHLITNRVTRILGTPATHREQQPAVRQLTTIIMAVTITVISTPTLTLTITLTLTLTHILTEKIWTVT
jgi:hypothetical protein